MMSAFGMFNALVMSYSRLPLAMAQDGMLPAVFMKVTKRTGAPWVAILVLATGWAMCLGLGFERLVTIDILLYGSSLALEFIALVVLRIKEPNLPRPFKVPGGLFGAIFIGVFPTLLLGFSIVRGDERAHPGNQQPAVRHSADRRRIPRLRRRSRPAPRPLRPSNLSRLGLSGDRPVARPTNQLIWVPRSSPVLARAGPFTFSGDLTLTVVTTFDTPICLRW